MKKFLLGLAVLIIIAAPMYAYVQNLKAEPAQDYAKVSPTVKVQAYRLARNGDIFQAAMASATIISPAGLLLTNSHVVLDDNNKPYDVFAVCLTFNENQEPVCEYSAFLAARDENLDLALLKMAGVNNRGGVLPALPFYNANFAGEVGVGQSLNIYGYPDIGGKTLTRTQGQLSGYEERSGVKYLKTDADISSGNSGGSALDESGNFVGVPTYVMSSYENIGYVLDIKEAQSFIIDQSSAEPIINEQAYALLKDKLNLYNTTKNSGQYLHPYYPKFSLTAANDWQWNNINRTSVSLLKEANEGDINININVDVYPFAVPAAYLEEDARKLGLISDYLTGYKSESAVFAGQPATLVTFNTGNQKFYGYVIPYGYAVVNIMYFVDLNRPAEDSAVINQVLSTFSFKEEPNNQPAVIETLAKSEPAFSVARSGQWRILRNQEAVNQDLIATYRHPADVDGAMELYYREIGDGEKELNNVELLGRRLLDIKMQNNFKLANQDSNVILDNLTGYSLTYSYEGRESQSIRKASEVYLRNGDYQYKFIYDDVAANYSQYLGDFKNILRSFKNYNQPENLIGKGQYQLGSLDYVFSDILYHRFEQDIADLAYKGVVYGYADGAFSPEKLITDSEAKDFIKRSVSVSKRSNANSDGAGFLTGGSVSLADALKAVVQTYNLNLWQNLKNDAPVWKPYIDKGYEMNLLPAGLTDYQQPLTRGEFVYILNQLLSQFEAM